MGPLQLLVTWRVPGFDFHILNVLLFVPIGVQAWTLRTRRERGPLGLALEVYEVLAVVGFVAASAEVFFNAWFIPYYGAAKYASVVTFDRGGIAPYFLIVAIVFLYGSMCGVPSMLSRRAWALRLGSQGVFMVFWVLAGFPVSVNVVPGASSFFTSVPVNGTEIAYYILWTSTWVALRARRGPA